MQEGSGTKRDDIVVLRSWRTSSIARGGRGTGVTWSEPSGKRRLWCAHRSYSGVRLIRRTNQPLPCPAVGSDFAHDAVTFTPDHPMGAGQAGGAFVSGQRCYILLNVVSALA